MQIWSMARSGWDAKEAEDVNLRVQASIQMGEQEADLLRWFNL